MFTIKHVDHRGNEFAMEAASFEATTDDQGIFRIMTYDQSYRDGNQTGLWAGAQSVMTPDSHRIYVMNRHGSTVADYTFLPSAQIPISANMNFNPAFLKAENAQTLT